ncbi:hypothetical protein PV382_23425 [Streptomyces scabiei]|uniref:hypothetical protein n=1 Tax=Streptomyces scabiei TaxID=1930 RepID=UPI000765A788|nr:hypothetical protein [Streptomyces scabiei]MDX2999146.1 hypothetical protein [Streptomyces scabiei]MDX3048703.1 hypothetical protein [Streptomyces scabiei]MDX3175204.1 hypothetical protein [Streptomyces scabiei]
MTTSIERTVEGREELHALIAAAVAQLVREWKRLTTAQDTLLHAVETIRPGPGATAGIHTAVRDFNAQVAEFDRNARAFTERWAAQDLPVAYRDGALRALERAGATTTLFQWTANHQSAITVLTATFYADLIHRVQQAVRRAQMFLRDTQAAARRVAAGSQHSGIDPARLTADHPLSTVIYANNARHPVRSWASSALGWQAVLTANTAAINTGRLELDCQWMQARDGDECGFRGHEDTDHADGSIRSVDDALAFPTAHFGCVREWIPRPDLNTTRGLVSGDRAPGAPL